MSFGGNQGHYFSFLVVKHLMFPWIQSSVPVKHLTTQLHKVHSTCKKHSDYVKSSGSMCCMMAIFMVSNANVSLGRQK